MPQSAFAALPTQAQASLAQLSRDVEGVLPVDVRAWTLQVAELSSSADKPPVVAEVEAWANKSRLCLYYFDCLSPIPDLAKVERAFADAKAHEANDRAYPRLNGQNTCFYVGSSQTVAKRFSEHLGYGAARTYALQLIHWAHPLQLSLQFVCAKYSDSTPYTIVQALEDALWESKQPMFGRQGRK